MNVENIFERKGTEIATITLDASIKRAADWLRAKNVGALVVTNNDAVLGIISERDIVRAFSQYDELVASGIISIGDVVRQCLDDLELEARVLRDVCIASHQRRRSFASGSLFISAQQTHDGHRLTSERAKRLPIAEQRKSPSPKQAGQSMESLIGAAK